MRKDNKWGFVDVNLNEIINFKYQKVGQFKEGFAKVCLNNKWGFINKLGELIIPCIYDEVRDFVNKLAIIELNTLFGIIDKLGNTIIEPKYNAITKQYNYYSLKNIDSNIWEHYYITTQGFQSKVE